MSRLGLEAVSRMGLDFIFKGLGSRIALTQRTLSKDSKHLFWGVNSIAVNQ
jgi:hypothetical protein